MKLVKLFSAMVVAMTLGATAVVATPQADLTAQAKARKSLKTIPKKFRGTWYYYDDDDNGYDYEKISASKIKDCVAGHTDTYTMHQFTLSKGIKAKTNPHKWMFAYKHGSKYIMDSWDWYFHFGSKRSGNYSMTTRKYKGKNVKVIKRSVSDSGGYWFIYSPSKAMAKHLWNLDNK